MKAEENESNKFFNSDSALNAKHETEMRLPKRWAEDPLSEFIQDAFKNSLATFVHKKHAFDLLLKTDGAFRRIGQNLDNAGNPLAPALLHRSHSAFLASCRLSMSGQATETFPLLRSCLEYALYALHINENPSYAEVWLRRHENEESLRTVKRSFKHVHVMETLLNFDEALHNDLSQLYEQTIDFGGHPNERGVSSSTAMRTEGDTIVIRNQLLHGDSLALGYALKITAQIGLGSMKVFRLIFRERFDLLGLRDTIDSLEREIKGADSFI